MESHQVDSSCEPTVAAPEAAPDSARYSAPDTAPDAVPYSAPDAVPEAASRSAPDAVPEAASRSAPDAVPETASRSAPDAAPGIQHAAFQHDDSTLGKPSILSASGISSWARSLRNLKQSGQGNPESENAGMSSFARFTKEFGSRLSSKFPALDETVDNSTTNQPGGMGSITKGLMDSSLSAVKAVQVKARHVVSQNKRRYQEGGFDLDMTYITHNIIAMGFPAGDMSSGLLGYVEGFYRNHMEEVIKFFETHHKAKYKVYNLCSERLYDAALFQGKVASFPFDDHNCPPIHLIPLFCQSASSWLKEDNDNVIAVHCKAGMARTGLMISSLLLFLKLFPTAEESMYYYNQKRCIDGKGLVLPSQIRYVKYFERILRQFNGDIPPGRRCMLRGFRLLHCPYWIRPSITVSNHTGILFSTKRHPKTKHLMPEDFWFSSKKKGIVVFALPAEPGLTELAGDFKIHFHDRQGDFYCWLNTTMMEDRMTLTTSDLDDFNKRSIPAPGFQVQILMVDPDAKRPTSTCADSNGKSVTGINAAESTTPPPAAISPRDARTHDNDDVFSDSEPEGSEPTRSRHAKRGSTAHAANAGPETKALKEGTESIGQGIERVSLRNAGVTREATSTEQKYKGSVKSSSVLETSKTEFKPVAADASVFSFGDEDEFDSD